MNKQQLTNLLGAGTISALAVALALMFGGRGTQADNAIPAQDTNAVTEVVTADSYNALIEQNAQLQEAVDVLQARETQYQEQITAAQVALDAQANVDGYTEGAYEEDEEYEEHEEHKEDDDD